MQYTDTCVPIEAREAVRHLENGRPVIIRWNSDYVHAYEALDEDDYDLTPQHVVDVCLGKFNPCEFYFPMGSELEHRDPAPPPVRQQISAEEATELLRTHKVLVRIGENYMMAHRYLKHGDTDYSPENVIGSCLRRFGPGCEFYYPLEGPAECVAPIEIPPMPEPLMLQAPAAPSARQASVPAEPAEHRSARPSRRGPLLLLSAIIFASAFIKEEGEDE